VQKNPESNISHLGPFKGPKLFFNVTETVPNAFYSVLKKGVGIKKVLKMSQKCFKKVPKKSQKGFKKVPKRFLKVPKRSQKGPKKVPKRSQKGPKMVQK
jgi:hypothetical protein